MSSSHSSRPLAVSTYSKRGGWLEYSRLARMSLSASHFSRSVSTLREMPRSAWSWSKRAMPTHTSRRISGDQGSPMMSRVRAIEQAMSLNWVRCMPRDYPK